MAEPSFIRNAMEKSLKPSPINCPESPTSTKPKYKVLLPTGEGRQIRILRRTCILAALLLATISAQAVRFRLPLSSDTGVHYYYDHNTSSGVTAWNCSGSSYNGH